MKSQPERLNDWLERQRASGSGEHNGLSGKLTGVDLSQNHSQNHADPDLAEVEELAALASRLQSLPQLRPDADFALRLEQRMLAHARIRAAQRTQSRKHFNWFFPRLGMAPATGVLLGVFLLLVLATGALLAAAHAADAENPLTVVTDWSKHFGTDGRIEQIKQESQKIQQQLKMLATLANRAHAKSYREALAQLDRQLTALGRDVNALPPGPDRDRMSREFATLKNDVRQALHTLLLRLDIPERLITTDELAKLGDSSVPRLIAVKVQQTMVVITGENIRPGAQLLLDDQLVTASSSLRDGAYVFVVDLSGKPAPQSAGIMNTDGTAAALSLSPGQNNGDMNGNSGNNGKGRGDQNNNGNGNAQNTNGGNNNRNGAGNTNGQKGGSDHGRGKPTPSPTPPPTS
ncbi:MAG: hypothetical protein IMW89_13085 [Ktedonobacteraceae bacterium]|nr:hypothetical protein [Ktedonobacteraceae bacterium]